MQLTNVQVLNVLQGLNILSQNKLPIRLAWKVSTAIRSLQEFAKTLDEPMQELRLKYAVRDDNGNAIEALDNDGNSLPNTVQIPNDKITAFNKEMNELLETLVEVTNVQFSLTDFPDTLELEPTVLTLLSHILTDEQTKDLKLVQ
jgi:hypothetical protein